MDTVVTPRPTYNVPREPVVSFLITEVEPSARRATRPPWLKLLNLRPEYTFRVEVQGRGIDGLAVQSSAPTVSRSGPLNHRRYVYSAHPEGSFSDFLPRRGARRVGLLPHL